MLILMQEWIFRVKSHLKRIGGEIAALDMIQTDLFSGTPPPVHLLYPSERQKNDFTPNKP
jgi:hypothetical protein